MSSAGILPNKVGFRAGIPPASAATCRRSRRSSSNSRLIIVPLPAALPQLKSQVSLWQKAASAQPSYWPSHGTYIGELPYVESLAEQAMHSHDLVPRRIKAA